LGLNKGEGLSGHDMPPTRSRGAQRTNRQPSCYITVNDLLLHEVASLKHMATVPWPHELSWQASLINAAQSASTQGELNLHLWFEAPAPRASRDAPFHCIELGAQIIPSRGSLVTYFFAIGELHGDQRRGLRKIDFDMDFSSHTPEPKPAMHSQISGRMSPSLGQRYNPPGFDNMIPAMDKPRIVCLPKSFALLAHLAFLEYQSTHAGISNLVSDPKWLSVVKAAEQRILKPHFDYCADWMQRGTHSLLSHFYESPHS
jgi:hypothetical protein